MRRTLAALCVVLTLLGIGASSAVAWSNGNAPASAMAPIASGVKCTPLQGQLANEAAASWNSMALGAGKQLPTNGCDSAYRPYDRQVYWATYWCGNPWIRCANAAWPGTSNHGLGIAVDIPTWVQGYVHLHGSRYGWRKTEAFQEPWHYNFTGDYHRPNPGTDLHSPTLRRHSGGPGQNIFVRKVQKLLRGHGDKTVSVDGEFGRSTAVAVRRFQKAQRLKVNGVVSRRIWKRLRRPISKPVKTTPKHVPQAANGGTTTSSPHHSHRAKPRHHKPKGPAWGIDISSAQGAVDFKAARADGASFVVTKATQGTGYINPYFGRSQVRAIGGAHLVPGVYDYLEPTTSHSGRAEAAFFVEAAGHAGYGKGFLPPVADIERSALSDAGTCRYLAEWIHVVKKSLGVKPIIYTFGAFPGDHMAGCSWLHQFDLWIAHPGATRPSIPSPWDSYKIWQYSWTGRVAGVNGDVDLNKVFHGRSALVDMRVKVLPKRARLAPRAKLALPLAAEPIEQLRAAAPAAVVAEPIAEVPAPEGGLETILPTSSPPEASVSLEQAIAELIHALAVLIGG
jgi:GH25 family lysozyme M1 (1,4-beta-N-acetylmuramidase)